MAAIDGVGADSGASVCICTGCAPCTAITKATGVACALTGTCGVATIITSDLDGSGADGVALVDTCTACESCVVGLVPAG